MELEVSGPLRDYLQELERDFSGGGLEFVDEEEEVDETEPESEGDESGWRAWECLSELAMVCWMWGGSEFHASGSGRYTGLGGGYTNILRLLWWQFGVCGRLSGASNRRDMERF